MNRKFLLSFLLCIFSSGQANAVIIEGEFGGIIHEISDRGNYDAEYTTFWRDVKIGDAVHGTYWYDTELAPAPSEFWDGKQLQYRNYGPDIPAWSGMTASVDGRVFDITQDQPAPDIWNLYRADRGILVTNEADTGFAIADGFGMINTILWRSNALGFSSTVVNVGIWQERIELFDSTELGQEFSWSDEKADPIYNGGVIGKSGYNDEGRYEAEVRFTATYATARVRKAVQVNEPGILLLIVIGISSILVRWQNKSHR